MKRYFAFFIATGAYQLFIYCTDNKIPISLDLVTTTSSLLIFGIATTMTTIMIGLTPCLLLAVTISAQESALYQKCFNLENKQNSKTSPAIMAIKNYTLLFSTTVSLFIIYFWNYESISNYISNLDFFLILIAEALAITLLSGMSLLKRNRYFIRRRIKDNIIRVKIYLTILSIKTCWFFSLFFTALWTFTIFKLDDEFTLYLILAIWLIINGIFLLPTNPKKSVIIIEEEKSIKKQIATLLDSIHGLSLILLVSILIIIQIHPIMVSKTSEAALKIFRIGGNIERAYHFSSSKKSEIPGDIVNPCKPEENCTTKKVKVIFDIGNILYVKTSESKIYELPREHLHPIIEPN